MKPTVSIIIPAYNAETTLDRCLESILTQSLRNIEVLCINDGSTDGTGEILTRWEKQDGRVRVWQFEENRGIVPAENVGIRASTGEYVMFVDSDDILLPGACENLVRLIEQNDVDILQFNIKISAPSRELESIWQKNLASKKWISKGVNILYDCYVMHRFPYTIWNRIYRGEVCRKAGAAMPDLKLSQASDVLQTFFFLYYAKTFRSISDGPYYEYSVGNGISTHKPTTEQFAQLCASSAILPAIEDFLRQENALENNRFLLEAIKLHMEADVRDTLMALPEITRETIDLAVKSWGSEVIYEFIRTTGLLDVPCETRYGMVTKLAEENRKLRNEKTTITISKTKGI